MRIGKILVVASVLLSLFPVNNVFSYESLGKPNGFVNDYLGVLNDLDVKTLESKVQDFEKKTGNEIAVVIIQSLNGDTIENFAEKLFKEWGIGKEGKDNGVLLLVAFNDHKLRIEVGYGLEPVLTDAQASQIIEKIIKPYFKSGDYNVGISKGISAIIASIDGDYSGYEEIMNSSNNQIVTTYQNKNSSGYDLSEIIITWVQILFWVFLFVGQWLISILARSKSWWLGGIIGGIISLIAAIVLTSINVLIYVGAVLVPLGLMFDYLVSKTYKKYKDLNKNPPWWAGGAWASGTSFGSSSRSSSWSSSSSSSSGGSFGGGSSGGGGASGSW
jgi:uncharacterized protein